jgi:hypothetical protein
MAEEDDVEIEVVPTPDPQPKRRRARTPNPEVDNVIHTGEIQPRSMIVRATDSSPAIPKVEIAADEPTEIAPPPFPIAAGPRPAAAPGRPLMWAALAVAILAGVAAAVLFAIDKPTPAGAVEDQSDHLAVQTAAQFMGSTLDADSKATLMRADVIASSSMLRAGILTDAQTLEDMAKDKDVVFSLKPGESVEVFQDRDGARSSMLRLPKGAPALSPPAVGKSTLGQRDGVPHVIGNAEIPAQQGTSGEVALDVPVDIEPLKKRVADHVLEASLVGLGPPIVLAKAAPGATGGSKVTVAIENEAHANISLDVVFRTHAVAAKKSPLRLVRFASLGLAALMMLVFLVSLARKPTLP